MIPVPVRLPALNALQATTYTLPMEAVEQAALLATTQTLAPVPAPLVMQPVLAVLVQGPPIVSPAVPSITHQGQRAVLPVTHAVMAALVPATPDVVVVPLVSIQSKELHLHALISALM